MTVFYCLVVALLYSAVVHAQIVQPTSGTVLTIGTNGRFESPTVVQWMSNKPATATVEITVRAFGGGLSFGDRNKLLFASPRANVTTLRNNVTMFDISQSVLFDFDGVAVKDAPVAAITLLLSNTSTLHVEVSCKITLTDALTCLTNDDFETRPIVRFAGGPCWFTNICAARGAPAEVRCATSGGDAYQCVCADGYQSDTPNGKCVRVATPTAGASNPTTTTGTATSAGVTTTAAAGPGSDASVSPASRVSAGLAALFCLLVGLMF
jgi:hypothetical protein